jgi:dTDP-4-amino-4,6-dideoxygalactose transaminase
VAVANGTAALHAACHAAGVEPGDEVITSPMTFAASANCALYLGARPVFCDIDPVTWNLDPAKLEALVTPRTRAVVAVHYAGQPADMDRIRGIARRRGLAVIEDAAHALGASLGGRPAGSLGDMACFSFHPVKHVTTGEGGAVATDDPGLARKLAEFRSHGITRDPARFTAWPGPNAAAAGVGGAEPAADAAPGGDGETATSPAPAPAWYYEQQGLGYNYRLSDIHAALGLSQLKKLGRFLARRDEIVRAYRAAFQGLADAGRLAMQGVLPDAAPAWHLFVARAEPRDRARLFDGLRARGIGANLHYIPVYLHPYYRRLGYAPGLCPVAEWLFHGLVTLPLYPRMSDGDVARVAGAVLELLG